MDNLLLLPYPRSLTMTDGAYVLHPQRRILLTGAAPAALQEAGRRLQATLAEGAGLNGTWRPARWDRQRRSEPCCVWLPAPVRTPRATR